MSHKYLLPDQASEEKNNQLSGIFSLIDSVFFLYYCIVIMVIYFSYSMLFFEWGCMVASALVSIRLINNNRIPDYMKRFYWYPIIGAITLTLEILQMILSILNPTQNGIFINSLLLFHYIFLSRFIYKNLQHTQRASILKVGLFCIFLLVILCCIFAGDLTYQVSTAFAFTNFGLVIFCCLYYFQVFEKDTKTILLKEPSFWIISGIFFCMCSTIPVSALTYYLMTKMPLSVFRGFELVSCFFYGTMHLFFIKGYLCSFNYKKTIRHSGLLKQENL